MKFVRYRHLRRTSRIIVRLPVGEIADPLLNRTQLGAEQYAVAVLIEICLPALRYEDESSRGTEPLRRLPR